MRVLAGDPALPRPFCAILGGETTVTLRGTGRGGRNQELALAAAAELDGIAGALMITLATDGGDGPTDAAGAVVDGTTRARAALAGLDVTAALVANDSYPFFAALDDLLRPGPTLTNVNDLVVCVVT
jgi:hydroxypyruvate reductase